MMGKTLRRFFLVKIHCHLINSHFALMMFVLIRCSFPTSTYVRKKPVPTKYEVDKAKKERRELLKEQQRTPEPTGPEGVSPLPKAKRKLNFDAGVGEPEAKKQRKNATKSSQASSSGVEGASLNPAQPMEPKNDTVLSSEAKEKPNSEKPEANAVEPATKKRKKTSTVKASPASSSIVHASSSNSAQPAEPENTAPVCPKAKKQKFELMEANGAKPAKKKGGKIAAKASSSKIDACSFNTAQPAKKENVAPLSSKAKGEMNFQKQFEAFLAEPAAKSGRKTTVEASLASSTAASSQPVQPENVASLPSLAKEKQNFEQFAANGAKPATKRGKKTAGKTLPLSSSIVDADGSLNTAQHAQQENNTARASKVKAQRKRKKIEPNAVKPATKKGKKTAGMASTASSSNVDVGSSNTAQATQPGNVAARSTQVKEERSCGQKEAKPATKRGGKTAMKTGGASSPSNVDAQPVQPSENAVDLSTKAEEKEEFEQPGTKSGRKSTVKTSKASSLKVDAGSLNPAFQAGEELNNEQIEANAAQPAKKKRKKSTVKTPPTSSSSVVDPSSSQDVSDDAPPTLTVLDSRKQCSDANVGGVAVALEHGSVHLEAAKYEVHASTAAANPNVRKPTRISLVFYQHRKLNAANHGKAMAAKEKRNQAKQQAGGGEDQAKNA
jgi:hypothetical protein